MKKYFPFFIIFIFLFFAQTALGQSWSYANPLPHTSLTGLIYGFLTTLQTIIGLLAVIMLAISGIVYITSTGDPARMELAKKIAIYTLSGFAIVVAGPTLLREIKDLASSGAATGSNIIEEATSIGDIIENVMLFLLTIFGILAVISFVFSGITYVTSAGDSTKADKAKKMIVYSIIGVVITGSGIILLNQIMSLLNISS